MNLNSRLSSVLHALLHMAEHSRPMTSDALAKCLGTNPVVVRRTMAGLRDAGIVMSEKGHGGGWRLARELAEISLAEVHVALGAPALFAFGNRNEQPRCLVEQAVNSALDDTLGEAEALIRARLSTVSLKDIAEDFHERMKRHPHAAKGAVHV